jgi:competence protein ComEA
VRSAAFNGDRSRASPFTRIDKERTMTSSLLVTLLLTLLVASPVEAAQPAPAVEAKAVTPAIAPVNINTAGVKELMTLEGIGKTVATRIVEYRQKNGPFARPEDLRRVSGVGKALWERNRERIVVK